MKKSREFLKNHIDAGRLRMKATGFIYLAKKSIRLSGQSVNQLISACLSKSKKCFETIVLEDEAVVNRRLGDIVNEKGVYSSSENLVWENNRIRFRSKNGTLLTGYQQEYITKCGLDSHKLFAQCDAESGDVASVWKLMTRKASEARKDKSKEILYLTIGTIEWLHYPAGKKIPTRASSPLLVQTIREEQTGSNLPRFKTNGDGYKINTILRREIIEQHNFDPFEGCEENVPLSLVAATVERIVENVGAATVKAVVCPEDIFITLLDSSNETICQTVERELDRLSESELIKVISDEEEYIPRGLPKPCGIFPLLADNTQREVIYNAIVGNSVNVSASAGTGKSQTMVNIAANMVVMGKSVCVMSEKAAANEVFIKYAGHIGLDNYCLVIDNKTGVNELVTQLVKIVNTPRYYVDATSARATLAAYDKAVKELETINGSLYDTIQEIGLSLYELIGEALSYVRYKKISSLSVRGEDYREAKQLIEDFQTEILSSIITEGQYKAWLQEGETDDFELNEMLEDYTVRLRALGVELLSFIKENEIEKSEVAKAAIANMSALLAYTYTSVNGLKSYGNLRLQGLYNRLTTAYEKMNKLYVAYMLQRLSEKVAQVKTNNSFVDILKKLKNSKIPLAEFFKQYGRDILKICPILVTTPSTAVNYVTNEMNTFDILMIDEASQVPIIGVLPFLAGNRQLIAFGDNMQLDTSSGFVKNVYTEFDEEDNYVYGKGDKTILDAVQGRLPSCSLKYHYRSKTEHLVAVSNRFFYEDSLNIIPDVYKDKDSLPLFLGYETIRIKDPSITPKGLNLSEAEEVVKKIIEIKENTPEKSIGVITLNVKQQGLIIDEIRKSKIDCDFEGDDESLWIRAIENAQGKEADVIIISLSHYKTTADGSLRQNISNLSTKGGGNKLNVLFTRAREKNIVIYSFNYEELADATSEGLDKLYKFMRYAVKGKIQSPGSSMDRACKDKLNDCITNYLSEGRDNCVVVGKVGRLDFTVDIALRKNGESRYFLGILMPSYPIDANTFVTKKNALVRAGWRIATLSPVSLLIHPEEFETIFSKLIEDKERTIVEADTENCLVSYPPAKPIEFFEVMKMEEPRGDFDFEIEKVEEEDGTLPPLSEAELAEIDFEDIYSRFYGLDLSEKTNLELKQLIEEGDSRAFILLSARSVKRIIETDRLDSLINRISYYYSIKGERSASYMLVQLLRTCEQEEINALLPPIVAEARRLGFRI